MPKKINESVILSRIRNLVVDEISRMEVIQAMKEDPILSGFPKSERAINIAVRDGIISETFKDGVSYLYPIIEEKGGEKMEKKDYKTRFTSGETKVAEAVLNHFKAAFEMGRTPSRMVFEECLETSIPQIKDGMGSIATKKLLNGKYIQEKEGKILLGEKGKEYLSL